MADLVVIDNGTIDQLLQNPEVVNAVPCLKNYPKTEERCGGCPSRPVIRVVPDYNAIKMCLRGLAGEARSTLKQTLNAQRLQVVYRQCRTKVKFTF